MKLSVVLPACNEEDAITGVIEKVQDTLLAERADYEIIVVDDGSTDATASRAEAAGAKVIRHPTNLGYGTALRRGIGAAQHEYIVIADADGTYPVTRIPELVRRLDEGFDMVVGARQGPHFHGSPLKRLSRWFFKRISEFTAGERIPDINSGFRAFRKTAVVPVLPYTSPGFSFTASVTLIFFARRLFVAYVPVEYSPRKGASKVRYLRDTLSALQAICEVILRFNPLKLFLMLSFVPLGLTVLCLAAAAVLSSPLALGLAGVSFLVTTLVWGLGLLSFAVVRGR